MVTPLPLLSKVTVNAGTLQLMPLNCTSCTAPKRQVPVIPPVALLELQAAASSMAAAAPHPIIVQRAVFDMSSLPGR